MTTPDPALMALAGRYKVMLITGFWLALCTGIYKFGAEGIALFIISVWAIWLAEEIDDARALTKEPPNVR